MADAAFATVAVMRDCGSVSDTFRMWHSVVEDTFATSDDGEARAIEAYRGDEDPDEAGDEDVYWDPETGLTLRWESAPEGPGGARFEGPLLATDAPLV